MDHPQLHLSRTRTKKKGESESINPRSWPFLFRGCKINTAREISNDPILNFINNNMHQRIRGNNRAVVGKLSKPAKPHVLFTTENNLPLQSFDLNVGTTVPISGMERSSKNLIKTVDFTTMHIAQNYSAQNEIIKTPGTDTEFYRFDVGF